MVISKTNFSDTKKYRDEEYNERQEGGRVECQNLLRELRRAHDDLILKITSYKPIIKLK